MERVVIGFYHVERMKPAYYYSYQIKVAFCVLNKGTYDESFYAVIAYVSVKL